MKWQYKGEWFKSISFDWHWACLSERGLYKYLLYICGMAIVTVPKYSKYLHRLISEDILIYVPKHDKCYTVQRFGVMGNGNKLKMCLEDIYTKKYIYVMAKDVELIIKCNERNS